MGIKNPYWRNVVICLDYIVQTPGFHFSATPQLGADCVCNSVGFADAGIGAGKSQIQMEQGIISSDVGIGGVPDIICRILDFGYGVG